MVRPDAQWCDGIVSCDTTTPPLPERVAEFVSSGPAYHVQAAVNPPKEVEPCADLPHADRPATSS